MSEPTGEQGSEDIKRLDSSTGPLPPGFPFALDQLAQTLSPGGGKGRPTDAEWTTNARVPLSTTTQERLKQLAELAGVGYTQLAARVIEYFLASSRRDPPVAAKLSRLVSISRPAAEVDAFLSGIKDEEWAEFLQGVIDDAEWFRDLRSLLPGAYRTKLDQFAALVGRLPIASWGRILLLNERRRTEERFRARRADLLHSKLIAWAGPLVPKYVSSHGKTEPILPISMFRGSHALEFSSQHEVDPRPGVTDQEIWRFPALQCALKPASEYTFTLLRFGVWDTDLLAWANDDNTMAMAREHRIRFRVINVQHLEHARKIFRGGLPDESGKEYFCVMMAPREVLDSSEIARSVDVAITNIYMSFDIYCHADCYEKPHPETAHTSHSAVDDRHVKQGLYDPLDPMPIFDPRDPMRSIQKIFLFIIGHEMKVIIYDTLIRKICIDVFTQIAHTLPYDTITELDIESIFDVRKNPPKKYTDVVIDGPRKYLTVCCGPALAHAFEADLRPCLRFDDIKMAFYQADGLGEDSRKLFEQIASGSFIHTSVNVTVHSDESPQGGCSVWVGKNKDRLDRLCGLAMCLSSMVDDYPMPFIRYLRSESGTMPSGHMESDECQALIAFRQAYIYKGIDEQRGDYYSEDGEHSLFRSLLARHPNIRRQGGLIQHNDGSTISHSNIYYNTFLDARSEFDGKSHRYDLILDRLKAAPELLQSSYPPGVVLGELFQIQRITSRMRELCLYRLASSILDCVMRETLKRLLPAGFPLDNTSPERSPAQT